MAGLGTIGQALYMRLFYLANLYDGRNGKSLFFRKLYDDILPNGLAD